MCHSLFGINCTVSNLVHINFIISARFFSLSNSFSADSFLLAAAISNGRQRVSSSTIVMCAVRAVRESGLRSIVITCLPRLTSAWQRSPSSSGTSTTSASPMPVRQHLARSEARPGMWKSGFSPSGSIPASRNIAASPATRIGERWNRFTSTCAGTTAASSAMAGAASAIVFPFAEITGRLALQSNPAAALMARCAGPVVRSPSK